ncbi:efflux RND transporter periplasmic adaptor subunit [Pseudoduganella umbonata]|uniref:Efflux RND transporter periplasmic adaptor subunit n=1 Tax=Pseudoduganella umbonata TaxID=864828 RepID=A0A4P8HJM2_9BURK|nr:efflux RND transporter periplasmic adaptor subunit [Pseudoduganella umbonata]MBB3219909.1 RND family efflux transporter MFP subunit [Pseudoduganella umbonata]QCP09929.1 efflux RND transporter periplasmic adaptor subunit [Pseudoduganella umbonata]
MKSYDSIHADAYADVGTAPAAASQRYRILTTAAFLAAAAILCLALFVTVGISPAGSPVRATPAPAAPSITVALAPVERVVWAHTVEASGAIEPWQEAVVGAQSAGLRLLEVHANVGDSVKRGQLLARFDDALLRAGLAELRASLAQAEAAARQAAANRQRMAALQNRGGVSQQELLQYETLAETSAAQVAVARAQVESRRLLVAQAEVRAPDDGIVSARGATVGAVAESGRELFRLIRQGRLEWHGQVTASQLAGIAPGQRIHLRLPDGTTARARVRRSAPRFDAQTRMATVYADIDRGSGAHAGMYAAGSVMLDNRPVLAVPASSIVVRDGRSHVFRLRPGSSRPIVEALTVRTGQRSGSSVAVEGVAAGERVVMQGAGFLKDGDAVRLLNAPVAAAAEKRG